MENRVLKYFLVVAREENITHASEILHISQPALSRQFFIGINYYSRSMVSGINISELAGFIGVCTYYILHKVPHIVIIEIIVKATAHIITSYIVYTIN